MDNASQNKEPSTRLSTSGDGSSPSQLEGSAGGRLAYWSLLIAIFAIPLWFTIGRAMLGSMGWMTIMLVISILPLLFILHIGMYILAGFGPVRRTLTRRTMGVLISYYAALFVYSIALVDGGDTADSISSVLSLVLVPHEVSQFIADMAFWASTALLTAVLTLLIIDAVKGYQLRAVAKQQA